MARVLGIGGVFLKAEDPEKLSAWYEENLGLPREHGAMAIFPWENFSQTGRQGYMVWSLFPRNTTYFDPSPAPVMVNFCVDDLGGMLDRLRERGVEIKGPEDSEYGRFAWIMDPEGNRVELWEPPAET